LSAALKSIPVGIVVERRKAASQWIDFIWRPIAALAGEAAAAPWTVLSSDEEKTTFFAGSAPIHLYRTETANYIANLASGEPSLWVALRVRDGDPPYVLFAVTADPAEGESFTEAGTDLVDRVAMPDPIREVLEQFVAEHHVERQFIKRERNRADPESLARRKPGAGHD
jgi:hypothetical protein